MSKGKSLVTIKWLTFSLSSNVLNKASNVLEISRFQRQGPEAKRKKLFEVLKLWNKIVD